MEPLKRRAVNSIAWFGSSRMVTQLITWAVSIVLVRILSPQDFGLVAMAMSYVSIVEIFYDFNIGFAILQKENITEEEIHSSFWFILGGAVLWYGISWFAANAVAVFYQDNQVVGLIRIMMAGLLFQSLSAIPFWLLTKNLDFAKRAKATMWAAIPSTILTLILALKGFGVYALAMRMVFFNGFFCIFLYCYFPWTPKAIFRFSGLRSILAFSMSVTGFRFFRYAAMKCDSIIIGKFLGAELLGYYRVALEFSRIPIDRGIVLVNQVSFPVYSELQNDTTRLRSYFLKINQWILFLALPIFLGAATMAHEAFEIILGEKWLKAVPLFQIMCLAAVPEALVGNLAALNNARGKPNTNLTFSLVSALALTVGFLVGVQFGLLGVASVWITVYPLIFAFFLSRSLKAIESSILEFFKKTAPAILGTLCMVVTVLVLASMFSISETGVAGSILSLTLGGAFYILCIFISDREFLREAYGLFMDLGFGKFLLFGARKRASKAGAADG